MRERDMESGMVTDPARVTASSGAERNSPGFHVRKVMGRSVVLQAGSVHLHALDMIGAVASRVGREVHVFVRPAALSTPEDRNTSTSPRPEQSEETDDFYEFTAVDYARVMASRKEEVHLKTRKIRAAEEAARRARITKATVRVQFPDNYVLEATFQSNDLLSLLTELLQKVVSRPDLPFYLYTTPPKKRIENLNQSMFDAGFVPGALVYFSYEPSPEVEEAKDGPYLQPEIQALRDLHLWETPSSNKEPSHEEQPIEAEQASVSHTSTSDSKRPVKQNGKPKPKWLKM